MGKQGLLLVGFEEEKLTDLVELIATEEGQEKLVGLLENKAIPHYKEFDRTTAEQQQAYMIYLNWLRSLVKASEEE